MCGVDALVARTGYTGEPGVELIVAAEDAVELWDGLLAAGAEPIGLGARDTLRLEMCYPLYGNDLDEQHTALEAGLGWACALDAKEFVGAAALRAQRDAGGYTPVDPVHDERTRDSPARYGGGRRRRGHQRDDVAVARDRHRNGLRAACTGRRRQRARDRRARPRGTSNVAKKPLYTKEI